MGNWELSNQNYRFNSKKEISGLRIGESMYISVKKFERSHLASAINNNLIYIQQDDNFGEIDFLPARRPSKRENLTAYTRNQFNSARHSLQLLAEACERNDPSLKRVVAFGGISHLAGPLARRLGFDTYPLDQTFLSYYRRTGLVIRRLNIGFRNANSNFKDPQCAVITREKLVSLYGKYQ